jgi:hypothetical protein
MPVIGKAPSGAQRIWRVRKGIWGLLAGALLVALALPTATLWHAATSAMAAHAYVWPAVPRANEPAKLIVVLCQNADKSATDGPWAQTQAEWDMVTMAMGTHPVAVPGSPRNPGVFTIPLQLGMAGVWWAHVTLRAPGRPAWQTQLQFTVLPPGNAPESSAPSPPASPTRACASSERSAGL